MFESLAAGPTSDEATTDNSGFWPANLIGHTLLVWATEHLQDAPGGVPRQDGRPPDAIVVDVVDLSTPAPDNSHWGLVATGVWWRPGRLIRDLRRRIGNPNAALVRMHRENKSMAPYELIDVSGDPTATALAKAWFQANHGVRLGGSSSVSVGAEAAPPGSSPPPLPSSSNGAGISGQVNQTSTPSPTPPPPPTLPPPATVASAPAPPQDPSATSYHQQEALEKLRQQHGIKTPPPPPLPPLPVVDDEPPF